MCNDNRRNADDYFNEPVSSEELEKLRDPEDYYNGS